MSETFVCDTIVTNVNVTAPGTNQLVPTKSKLVEVLSVQCEMIEYEDVDSSETEADAKLTTKIKGDNSYLHCFDKG